MADGNRINTLSKRDLAGLGKWANMPAGAQTKKLGEERKKAWTSLNEFITERGGRVTSVPYALPLRAEAGTDSTLADQLAKSGCRVVFVCRETRVVGASINAKAERLSGVTPSAFREMNLFEVDLPR
jgi:hypothetical protein